MPVLEWLNKNEAVKTVDKIPYRLLKANPELSYGEQSENMIIKGDNLEGLKALLPYYKGQVKCIFIDPPYNTGNAFEHYDDNIEHSKWLSLIYPRLELLRDLLSEDGSMWIAIDDDECHYLKVICDEIFGRKNFVRNVVWQKKYAAANDAKGIPDAHDHILIYQKSEKFSRNLLPRTEKQNVLYKYDSNDGMGRWRSDNLSVKTYSKDYDYPIVNPITKEVYYPPKGRAWLTNKTTMKKWIADTRVFFGQSGKGAPQLKRYLKEVQNGILATSWWMHEDCGHNDESRKESKLLFGDTPFSTPKPERLLQRVILLSTNEGDLVLDSFLGSATTAAVAHKMGRKYIGIEMGEHAITHCVPRLKAVIDGEQGGISKALNWQGGGGFTFYDLAETVFEEDGNINKQVDFKTLASHIWFVETKIPLVDFEKSTLIGVFEDTAYYLLYNGILGDKKIDGGNVLTQQLFDTLPSFEGKKVIYGEATRMNPAKLKALNITFKQTPYDVKAR